MKIILVPVDFSPATAPLVQYAGSLAKALDAYVVLLHVVRGDGAANIGNDELPGVALQGLKRSLRDRQINTQGLLLRGDPATDIVEQAAKLRASYLIIGSQGHGPLHRLMLGSTTHAVLKHAACPVVILPPGFRPRRLKAVLAAPAEAEPAET